MADGQINPGVTLVEALAPALLVAGGGDGHVARALVPLRIHLGPREVGEEGRHPLVLRGRAVRRRHRPQRGATDHRVARRRRDFRVVGQEGGRPTEFRLARDLGAEARGGEEDRRLARGEQGFRRVVAPGVPEGALLRHVHDALQVLDELERVDPQFRVQPLEAVRLGGEGQAVQGRVLLQLRPTEPGRGHGRELLLPQGAGGRDHLRPGRGRRVRVQPGALEGVLVDPHDGGGRVERHGRQPPIRQTVVAAHGGDVSVRVDRHPRLLGQLPDLLHRAARGEHGAGADLEHLHQMRRLIGAPGGDGGGQRLGIAALVDRLHLVVRLRGVEPGDEALHLLPQRAGQAEPEHHLGPRPALPLGTGEGGRRRGERRGAGEQGATLHG